MRTTVCVVDTVWMVPEPSVSFLIRYAKYKLVTKYIYVPICQVGVTLRVVLNARKLPDSTPPLGHQLLVVVH